MSVANVLVQLELSGDLEIGDQVCSLSTHEPAVP
jgi:hypothetical protein